MKNYNFNYSEKFESVSFGHFFMKLKSMRKNAD